MNSQSGNDIDFNVGIAGYGTLWVIPSCRLPIAAAT